MLNCHPMGHEATHRKARKENTVQIDLAGLGQGIEQGHQKTRVVGGTGRKAGIPHGAVAFVQGLWYHNGPPQFIGDLLEVEFVVESGDVVAEPVEEIHHRNGAFLLGWGPNQVFPLDILPFEVLDLGERPASRQTHRQQENH